jgi:hypothetical protein
VEFANSICAKTINEGCMTVEIANKISELDISLPLDGDIVKEGAGHLRTIKKTIKQTFPNVNNITSVTSAQLDALATNPITDLLYSRAQTMGYFDSFGTAPPKWDGTNFSFNICSFPHLRVGLNLPGYNQFRVAQPAPGQVINGFDGAANVTVNADGIPLAQDTVLVAMPLDSAGENAFYTVLFRIYPSYRANFSVNIPVNAVWIAANTAEGLKLCNGATLQARFLIGLAGNPAFQNSWLNFNVGFELLNYSRDSRSIVTITGLIRTGTLGTTVFTLPVGFRPSVTIIRPSTASGQVPIEVRVAANGDVSTLGGNNTYQIVFAQFAAEQ